MFGSSFNSSQHSLQPDDRNEASLYGEGNHQPVRPKSISGIVRSLPSLVLDDEVGNNKSNTQNDMTGLQEQLAGLGYLPERHASKPDLFITKPIEDAIRRFQMDNNLKNDGWAGPKGETERTINKRVGEEISILKKPNAQKAPSSLMDIVKGEASDTPERGEQYAQIASRTKTDAHDETFNVFRENQSLAYSLPNP